MTTPGHDRRFAAALLALSIALWLSFFVHSAPRFAGSALGGAFGVSAALLLLLPLGLSVAKRVPWARRASIPRLLQVHVYAGLGAAVLALIHTGHKFDSVLGIALTAALLATVLSGFVGLYFYRFLVADTRTKTTDLAELHARFAALRATLDEPLGRAPARREAAVGIEPAASAIAELEHSIYFEDVLQASCRGWLRVHIASSIVLYTLLVLHIWAGVEFGLRWFE
jgi:hypothetical protein